MNIRHDAASRLSLEYCHYQLKRMVYGKQTLLSMIIFAFFPIRLSQGDRKQIQALLDFSILWILETRQKSVKINTIFGNGFLDQSQLLFCQFFLCSHLESFTVFCFEIVHESLTKILTTHCFALFCVDFFFGPRKRYETNRTETLIVFFFEMIIY